MLQQNWIWRDIIAGLMCHLEEKKIPTNSALFSYSLCVEIHELLLFFIFLIKIESLALAQIFQLH